MSGRGSDRGRPGGTVGGGSGGFAVGCAGVAPQRQLGRPVAHPADKIKYARLLKKQGTSYGEISAKTGIPKTSLHRYLQG